jgi:hypothetical protein
MNNQQRPSPLRIIQNDYIAFMAVVLTLSVWIIFFFGNTNQSTNFLYISIAITLGAIALLAWRISFFTKLFEAGEETTAVVQGIHFRRSRGLVNYSYTYQGTNYSTDNLTTAIGHSKKLEPDQEVSILIDPDKPDRAVIKSLFT